jgi:hypothetical protein
MTIEGVPMSLSQKQSGMQLYEQGLLQAAYGVLEPLSSMGDPEVLCLIGSLALYGLHRFSTYDELEKWQKQSTDDDRCAFSQAVAVDRSRAVCWLIEASEKGMWEASWNLAVYFRQSVNVEENQLTERYYIRAQQQRAEQGLTTNTPE